MKKIDTFDELTKLSDYSFLENLNCDPDTKSNADNKTPREVFSGHYVPVKPTALKEPIYISIFLTVLIFLMNWALHKI